MNILETQLATVASGDTLTGTKDETGALDANASEMNESPDERGPDEVLVDEHGAPVFRADDLAILEAHNDAPIPLECAAKALVEMANDWPMYPSTNPIYGRFEFSNYAESSLQIRAVFRIARAALDFLEKDFKASETENFAWLENELAKFRAQGEAA